MQHLSGYTQLNSVFTKPCTLCKIVFSSASSFEACLDELGVEWQQLKHKKTFEYPKEFIPFLTVCISCTSSWSSRLALQKTLLFLSFIWAAKNGHLVTVTWLALWLAEGGWLTGSWDLLLSSWVTFGEILASGKNKNKKRKTLHISKEINCVYSQWV